jgi:hypothetical protein
MNLSLKNLFRKSKPQFSKAFSARLAAASQPGETFPLPGVPGAKGRTPNPPAAQREPAPEAVALLARLVSTISEDELSQLKELNAAWPGLTLSKIVSMAEAETRRRPSGATKAATAKPAAAKNEMTFAEHRKAGILVYTDGEVPPDFTTAFFRACGQTNLPAPSITPESRAMSANYAKAIQEPSQGGNYSVHECKAKLHESIPVRQTERFSQSVWI